MGADKKIGISKEQRRLASRYAKRFLLHDYKLVLSRSSGKRVIYLIGIDENDITYRIRFDKVKRMRKPKGVQVVNKKDYLVFQATRIYGDTYDYSLIKEEDITFSNKLEIVCEEHGSFFKRKSAHITDREGCPKCSMVRYNINRKYRSSKPTKK